MRRGCHLQLIFVLGLHAAFPLPAPAEEAPSGREVMERALHREDGDDGVVELEMTLIDKQGGERVRRIRSYFKDKDGQTRRVMFFLEPPDVEDVAFLTYDYDPWKDRDDDQWLYLPALRKTKRIAAAEQSGSFMGSDFNYSDMTWRDLDRYDHTLIGEGSVDGADVWQVEAVPRTREEIEATGYRRSIYLIRKDNHVVVRAIRWVNQHRLRFMEVKKIERISGVWVPTETHMTTKVGTQTHHKTVLRSLQVRLNQGLPDRLFTVRAIEKGLFGLSLN